MQCRSLLKSLCVCALTISLWAGSAAAAPEDTVADGVLGQNDFTSNQSNQGGTPSASTLSGVRGLTVDQATGRLWVCDNANNRVLSWPDAAAFTNGQAADIVLGQADFTSVDENRGDANPSELTLSGPRGAVVDSAGRLYVADSGNKRILRYDPPFLATNEPAVQVFGQGGSFTTKDQAVNPTADNLGNPDGVGIDPNDNLYLADLNLHRVLVYNSPATTDTTADIVLGQPNFTSKERNQNDANPVPAANTLNNPEGVTVDANGNVYVSDQGNNRVVRYVPPITTNMNATRVYGQPDFATNTSGTSATKMDTPVSVAVDPVSGNLYVADSINDRILEFTDPANDSTADRVFGQTDFSGNTNNPGGVSASTLFDVGGVACGPNGALYAGDRFNERALRYNPAPDNGNNNGNDNANGNDNENDNGNENDNDNDDDDDGMADCGAGLCGTMGGSMAPIMALGLIGLRRRNLRSRSVRSC